MREFAALHDGMRVDRTVSGSISTNKIRGEMKILIRVPRGVWTECFIRQGENTEREREKKCVDHAHAESDDRASCHVMDVRARDGRSPKQWQT